MRFSGLHVPLITPFTADGLLDADALAALAHTVLEEGAAGIVALGTTGEPATLDPAERRRVVEVCAAICTEHDAPLLVGTGSSSTTGTIDALEEIDPRAAAALVLVPPYSLPSQDGVVEHFRRLSESTRVPLMVYNVPSRTGVALSVRTLHRLAELPNVVGMKHCAGAIDDTTVAFLSEVDPELSVLAGDDLHAGPMVALGARGAVMASANVSPRAYADLLEAWRSGPSDRARTLHNDLVPLTRALFAEPNPAVIKAVLAARGRIPRACVRQPMLPASPAALTTALAALSS